MDRRLVFQVHHVELDTGNFDEAAFVYCRSQRPHGRIFRALDNPNCIDIIKRGNTALLECDSCKLIKQRINYATNHPREPKFYQPFSRWQSLHVLRVFGRTLESESISVEVHGIRPYFYMRPRGDANHFDTLIPIIRGSRDTFRGRSKNYCELIASALLQALLKDEKNPEKLDNGSFPGDNVLAVHCVLRKSFFRYSADECLFLRVSCRNSFIASRAIRILATTPCVERTTWNIYGLYHHLFRPSAASGNSGWADATLKLNIPQYVWIAQFLHDAHIRGMDWIKLNSPRIRKKKRCSTDLEVVTLLHSLPLKPVSGRKEKIIGSQEDKIVRTNLDRMIRLSMPSDTPSSYCERDAESYNSCSPLTFTHAVRACSNAFDMTLHFSHQTRTEHARFPRCDVSRRYKCESAQTQLHSAFNHSIFSSGSRKSKEKFRMYEKVQKKKLLQHALSPKYESSIRGSPTNERHDLPLCLTRLLFIECLADGEKGIVACHIRIGDKARGIESSRNLSNAIEKVIVYSNIPNAGTTKRMNCQIEIFQSEASLILHICQIIFQYDPDFIISWDHDRLGLNLIKQRYFLLTRKTLNVGRYQKFGGSWLGKNNYGLDRGYSGDLMQSRSANTRHIVHEKDTFLGAFSETCTNEDFKKSNIDADIVPDVGATESTISVQNPMRNVCVDNGRIILNLWQVYRNDHGPDRLSKDTEKARQTVQTLNAATWYLFGHRMPEFPPQIFAKYLLKSGFTETDTSIRQKDIDSCNLIIDLIQRHLCHRHQLLYQIIEQKWGLIENISFQCLLYGTLFSDALSRGSQFRVESVLSRDIDTQGLLYPSVQGSLLNNAREKADEFHFEHRQPGAIPLVLEPKKGFYTDPVVVLDFRALYPSIMVAYNLCYSTSIKQAESIFAEFPDKDKPFVAPNGEVFVPHPVHAGCFPSMLRRILAYRIKANAIKRKVSEKTENRLYEKLDRFQRGLKNLANVSYGYTSAYYSGRLPCVELADAIVTLGRLILERTIQYVGSQCDRWKKDIGVSDVEVVYGDTDSLFVHVQGSRKKANEIAKCIVSWVGETFPSPIALKIEKIFHPCFLLESKRYTGNAFYTSHIGRRNSQEEFEYKWEAKGLECVRRDYNVITEIILRESIKKWFHCPDSGSMSRYLTEWFEMVLSNEVSPVEFLLYPEMKARKFDLRLEPGIGDFRLRSVTENDSRGNANSHELRVYQSGRKPSAPIPENLYRDGGPRPNERHRDAFLGGPRRARSVNKSNLPVVVSASQSFKLKFPSLDRERVPYLIQLLPIAEKERKTIKGPNQFPLPIVSRPLYEKVIHPIVLWKRNTHGKNQSTYPRELHLDVVHYLKHKIAPPLQRVFKHTPVDVYSCIKLAKSSGTGQEAMKRWEQFNQETELKAMSKKDVCKVCKKTILFDCSSDQPRPMTNICNACFLVEQRYAVKSSIAILQSSTDELYKLHVHCKKCMSMENYDIPFELPLSCTNFECSKYYERASVYAKCNQAKSDMKNACNLL